MTSVEDITIAARNAAADGSRNVELLAMISHDHHVIMASVLESESNGYPVFPYPDAVPGLGLELTPELIDDALASETVRDNVPLWTYALIRHPYTSTRSLARVIDGLTVTYESGHAPHDWTGIGALTVSYAHLHRPALISLAHHPNLTDDLASRMLTGIPGSPVPLFLARDIPAALTVPLFARAMSDARERRYNAESNKMHYRGDLTEWLYPGDLLIPSIHATNPLSPHPDPDALRERSRVLASREPQMAADLALLLLGQQLPSDDRIQLLFMLTDTASPVWRHMDDQTRSKVIVLAATE